MKKLILILFFVSLTASAATAFLINSHLALSVTGQSVWVCIYQYNGQSFERTIPSNQGPCPYSIEIQ